MKSPFPGLLPDWIFFRFKEPVPAQDELEQYFGFECATKSAQLAAQGMERLNVSARLYCLDFSIVHPDLGLLSGP